VEVVVAVFTRVFVGVAVKTEVEVLLGVAVLTGV
jgi:hypothetical protein